MSQSSTMRSARGRSRVNCRQADRQQQCCLALQTCSNATGLMSFLGLHGRKLCSELCGACHASQIASSVAWLSHSMARHLLVLHTASGLATPLVEIVQRDSLACLAPYIRSKHALQKFLMLFTHHCQVSIAIKDSVPEIHNSLQSSQHVELSKDNHNQARTMAAQGTWTK